MRHAALTVLLLGLLGCISAPPAEVAVTPEAGHDGGGQLWVPEGPLTYHACVESTRALLKGRTADQRAAFESCVGIDLLAAHTNCKGESARYGDTLRPVTFGDLGGCIKSWTVSLSRDCCEDALACTLPATASPR